MLAQQVLDLANGKSGRSISNSSNEPAFRRMAAVGLSLISHLIQYAPDMSNEPPIDMLALVAAFTDSQEPWVSVGADQTASDLLLVCVTCANAADPRSSRKMLTALLEDKVKPLFSRRDNVTITKQGRKVIGTMSGSAFPLDPDAELKPWKAHAAPTLPLLNWILQELDVRLYLS